MGRILVTEELAESGLAAMREAGHDVDVRLGLSPEELVGEIATANALVVRSATKVTADVLEAARELVVVGRAGIGLDNVDVKAATSRGVMVVNAPQSNILSAAEHTMALLLAQARNVPQANAALKAGRWERSKWEGVELHGKVLGVIGLGRIGALVAQRALAFGMRLLAYDPYVSPDRARQMGVELRDLEEIVRHADFLTIHLPKTPETLGLIGEALLKLARPELRIINCARGGIVDEAALAAAVAEGRIAGAALDVFAEEPTTSSPLFDLDAVVVTPHLGASTREAQDKAGQTIAEQVVLALGGEFVPFAVNVSATEASETVRPYLPLAERLGSLYVALSEGLPPELEVEYRGGLADYDCRILTLAVLRGALGGVTEEPVSYVNAPQLASERGIDVRESKTATTHDFVNLVVVRGGEHAVAGTLAGAGGEPRIVMVDDHQLDVPPARNMLLVRNDDRPGMVGLVGTTLGNAGVNIENLDLGRIEGGTAMMVLSTSQPVPTAVLDELRASAGILYVHSISASPS